VPLNSPYTSKRHGFYSTRVYLTSGLRQGDPLAAILFALLTEALSALYWRLLRKMISLALAPLLLQENQPFINESSSGQTGEELTPLGLSKTFTCRTTSLFSSIPLVIILFLRRDDDPKRSNQIGEERGHEKKQIVKKK